MKNREKLIEIDYKTIGVEELRLLNDLSKLNIALTEEEFDEIMMIYKKVADRLLDEAEKQGIDI